MWYVWASWKTRTTPKICGSMSDFSLFLRTLRLRRCRHSSLNRFVFAMCGKQRVVCVSCVLDGSIIKGTHLPQCWVLLQKVYSRAGRATRRKGSFFCPSWLAAKGQRYLRLWLLCCFCLAPPIEDRKWAWRELNTAPSRFSSPRGGYSHRKVKLSDKETQ